MDWPVVRAHLSVPGRRSVAVGCAATVVLGAGIVTAATRGDASARETRLVHPVGVTLRLPDGSIGSGYDGDLLPDGTRVRTADGGAATLVTGGRSATLLGAGSVVVRTVRDYSLDSGSLIVDAAGGPSLSVAAGSVLVDGLAGVVRLDRGYSVRIATYSATGSAAHVSVPTGASADVARLRQLQVAAVALPPAAPLRLAVPADTGDRVADPALVALEGALDARAATLDGDTAVAAGLRSRGVTARPSETLLPAAIAIAADADVTRAQSLRAESATWGVIAAALGATAVRTESALDGLLAIDSSGTAPGPVTLAVAAPSAPAVGLSPAVPAPPQPPAPSDSGSTASTVPPTGPASSGPVVPVTTLPAPSPAPPSGGRVPTSVAAPTTAAPTSRGPVASPPSASTRPSATASPAPTTAPSSAAPSPPGAVDGLLQAVASAAPSPVATLLPTALPTLLPSLPATGGTGSGGTGSGGTGSGGTGSGTGAAGPSPSASPNPGLLCTLLGLCPHA